MLISHMISSTSTQSCSLPDWWLKVRVALHMNNNDVCIQKIHIGNTEIRNIKIGKTEIGRMEWRP